MCLWDIVGLYCEKRFLNVELSSLTFLSECNWAFILFIQETYFTSIGEILSPSRTKWLPDEMWMLKAEAPLYFP